MMPNIMLVTTIMALSFLSWGSAQMFAYKKCPKLTAVYGLSMEKIKGQKWYALAQTTLQGTPDYGDSEICAELTISKELKMDWNILFRSAGEWSIQGELKLIGQEKDGLFNITFPTRTKEPYEYVSVISEHQNYEYLLIYGCHNTGNILTESVVVSWFLSRTPFWSSKSLKEFQQAIEKWGLKSDDYRMVEQDYEKCRQRTTVSPPHSSTTAEVKTSTTPTPETTEVKLTALPDVDSPTSTATDTESLPTTENSNSDQLSTPEGTSTTQENQDKYLIPEMQNTWQNLLSVQSTLLLALLLLVITTIIIGAVIFFVAVPFFRDRRVMEASRFANDLSANRSVPNLPKYEETGHEKTIP